MRNGSKMTTLNTPPPLCGWHIVMQGGIFPLNVSMNVKEKLRCLGLSAEIAEIEKT